MPTDLPPPREPETPPAEAPWRGVQGAILLVSLVALVVVFVLPLVSERVGRGRPLKVAILEATIRGDLDERRRDLVAQALRDGSERALAMRHGLIAEAVAGDAGDAAGSAALARRIGADEALSMVVDCDEGRCVVVLRRLRAVDGSLERPQQFRFDPAQLLDLERALESQLHLAFLKFGRRTDGARVYCPEIVYQRYLGLLVDARIGRLPGSAAAARLASLRREAPRFHGLYLREAELHLERDTPEAWRRSSELLLEARRIAPGDVRSSLLLVPLLLKLGRLEETAHALGRLEALLPGDPRLADWRRHAEEVSRESTGAESTEN